MKAADIKKIRKKMEKTLDAKRFEHTLGVAYTAASLAMRYDEDINRALTAGLLHDCAKCISNEKKIAICEKHNIPINEVERENPFLLHAKVGSYMAMKQFNIHDQDIINAILNHTTGRPGMSPLEKIVYIADYIEPGRKQAPNLQLIRKMAFENIDQALVKILGDTLQYLESTGTPIDAMTQKTYDFYILTNKQCANTEENL
ncbi:MAG: HD domain-containing protein [Lachnospiraceae bacterium]|nr:HD domain-containing protein [Lachnospiraceae bacterium]